MSLSHDAPTGDAPSGSAPVTSPGRRDAVRSLAGIGAASVALFGRGSAASARSSAEIDGPAGPGVPGIVAAK